MKNLAIIIPYYKIDFFDAALASIANQTCKNFTVYIGDDCSPNDPSDIVNKYSSRISVKYHRFEDNLGGRSLVAHWERCIALSEIEEWIWLFSDDDVMDEGCVAALYNAINKSSHRLFHFNTRTINSSGDVVNCHTPYPVKITNSALFKKVRTGRLHNFVVEYIFSREIYKERGGFEEFPLAWGSDLATWCKFSDGDVVFTLNGPRINWRRSDKNITPDGSLAYQKCSADIECLDWYKSYFNNKSIRGFVPKAFLIHLFHYANALTEEQIKELLNTASKRSVISKWQSAVFLTPGLLRFIRKIKKQKGY